MAGTNEKRDLKEIVFVNHILDNVHGFIGLTELENRIEILPIFKRLQDISQLGLVKRIFPGALHNRYVHSLGVMHIIDQMALHLKEFNAAERQLLRLAGMLHDLGHYPLSHDLEQVYDREGSVQRQRNIPIKEVFIEEAAESIGKIVRVEEIEEGKPIPTEKMPKPKRKLVVKGAYHHESITSKVIRNSNEIRKIIKYGIEEGYFDEPERSLSTISDSKEIYSCATKIINDICALIQGDGDYQYQTEGAFPKHFTAMIQLLHSELDADRIDYLLRDATFSGAAYGTFDIGLLLQNLAMKEYTTGTETAWIVGVKEKGIGCADQYMMNRYLAYTQVIFHKYTSIIGKMLREVVLWMMNQPGFGFYDQDEIDRIIEDHENSGFYFAFTDSYFFNYLNAIDKGKSGCPDDIYYFVEQLKKFRSLEVDFEDIFAGNANHQKKHIETSDCYKYILELEKRNAFDIVDGLYLFDNKKITDHVPYEIFEKNFKAYSDTHKEELTEEEMSRGKSDAAKLSFDKYKIDRLMDGLAVISNDPNVEPMLLIDAPRSMTTEIYDVCQLMCRKYLMNVTDAV